jgi:hypothetical protein
MVGVIGVVLARVVNVFVERIIGKLCDCPMTREAWKGVGLVRVWSGGDPMVESRPPCRGDEIGKHSGLKLLSARPETAGVEPLKFGEPPGFCALRA